MAKRQQVTKLLAVMVITTSPALAGPEHGHAHAPAAARSPVSEGNTATRACEGAEKPRPALQAAPAAYQAPQAQPARQAQPAPAMVEAIMTLLGISRPRELPNGRPAPGNVGRRTPSRSQR